MTYLDFARHKMKGLSKARQYSSKKTGRKYYVEASEDAGLTYKVIHSSDDLEFLRQIGDQLDSEGLRWVIKESRTGKFIDYSAIHQKIINQVKNLQEGGLIG